MIVLLLWKKSPPSAFGSGIQLDAVSLSKGEGQERCTTVKVVGLGRGM